MDFEQKTMLDQTHRQVDKESKDLKFYRKKSARKTSEKMEEIQDEGVYLCDLDP